MEFSGKDRSALLNGNISFPAAISEVYMDTKRHIYKWLIIASISILALDSLSQVALWKILYGVLCGSSLALARQCYHADL